MMKTKALIISALFSVFLIILSVWVADGLSVSERLSGTGLVILTTIGVIAIPVFISDSD